MLSAKLWYHKSVGLTQQRYIVMSVTCSEPRHDNFVFMIRFGTFLDCIKHESAAFQVIQKVLLMTYDDSMMTYLWCIFLLKVMC